MRVNPHATEARRWQALINLRIEEVGDGGIVEVNRHGGATLPNKLHVFDPQKIVGCRNPKAAHFGRAEVSQEQQLRPRGRAELQRRLARARIRQRLPTAGFRPPPLGIFCIVH